MGVVALIKPLAGDRHDARLRVGEIDLILVTRATSGRFGVTPTGLLAGLALRLPPRHLFLIGGLLGGVPLLGARLDLGLRLSDGRQAGFTAGNLGGDIHAVGRVLLVRRLGPLGQRFHLCPELCLQLLGMAIRQRLVLAGVGLELGAVQGDGAKLEQLHLAGQQQHLYEQLFQFRQKAAAKGGQRVMVGMGIGGQVAERHRVIGGTLDLAAGDHPGGVAVDQQAQ